MNQPISIITGANRGLGLATAAKLARMGKHVWLSARTLDKAQVAAQPLLEEGLSISPKALDVGSDDSVSAFVNEIQNAQVQVEILCNNAGAIFEEGLDADAISADIVLQALNTNSVGPYRLLKKILPLMNRDGYGRVVNVSSGMGALNDMSGGYDAYRISKTALNAVTRIFHAQAGGDVKVNAVCPGWVRTDMGGPSATRDIEEGIEGIIWAATLPQDGPSGGFFRDGKAIDW